nr:hypothetical protein Q903MT_gene1158 [Picea sitchensis]
MHLTVSNLGESRLAITCPVFFPQCYALCHEISVHLVGGSEAIRRRWLAVSERPKGPKKWKEC